MIQATALKVTTPDNYELSATRFNPELPGSRKVILIGSALDIKQQFYHKFAEYLCRAGYLVYTYDYRGIGASKPQNGLKKSDIKLRDWGQKDYPGMLSFLAEQHPEADFFFVGNSVGGNQLGMSPLSTRFKALVTVGSQHGYWRLFWKSKQPTLWFLWYVLMPGLTRLYGYFPAALVGMGEDLPKGVALEWAKVCKNPHWFFDLLKPEEQFFEALTAPVLAISIDDDYYAPQKAVDALFERGYKNAQTTRLHILLKDTVNEPVGHFGFFRGKFLDTFGKMTLDWLEGRH